MANEGRLTLSQVESALRVCRLEKKTVAVGCLTKTCREERVSSVSSPEFAHRRPSVSALVWSESLYHLQHNEMTHQSPHLEALRQ
jgi:hypothetical protein